MANAAMAQRNNLDTIDLIIVNATTPEPIAGGWHVLIYGAAKADGLLGGSDGVGYSQITTPVLTFNKVAKQDEKEASVWKPSVNKKTGKPQKNTAPAETVKHIEAVFWESFCNLFADRNTAHTLHVHLLLIEAQRRMRRALQMFEIAKQLEEFGV